MGRWWIRRVIGVILFAAVWGASAQALAVRPPNGGGGGPSIPPAHHHLQSVQGYRLATLLLVVALLLAIAVILRMRRHLIEWERIRAQADPHSWASISAGSHLEG